MPRSAARRRATGDARISCSDSGGASAASSSGSTMGGGSGMPVGSSGVASESSEDESSTPRPSMSSPASPMIAIGWPTGTVVPSAASIFLSSPAAVASTSTTALSVSISAIGSPRDTSSSSDLSHRTRVPSCMS